MKTSSESVATWKAETLPLIMDVNKYSTFTKLLRVTAHVIKFKNNLLNALRSKKSSSTTHRLNKNYDTLKIIVTAAEIEEAKLLWVRGIQHQHLVRDGDRFAQLKKQLKMFCDETGLWRCGGRLKNADLSYNTKYPFLLPKSSHFTKLVVENSHWDVMHNDVKETLNNLRSEFWITRSRNYIRKIIHDCWLCNYFEGKSYNYPETPPLPEFRVKQEYPFTYTGVDYAGPFFVKNIYDKSENTDMHKCWLALFTCASSRCVFLDLVPYSSGEACVSTLRRFISSRGAPKLFVSDNGSAFISREVQDHVSSKYIRWEFNTEAAPWKGGFFERMIKSVKRCLKKVLINTRLTYEELLTVIKEVENTVNNRPLVYMYDDVHQEVLTPNKLLFGRNLETSASTDEVVIERDLSRRAKYINTLLNQWWRRWSKDYLTELREHQKIVSKTNSIDPIVGDIVLIEDDKLKRSQWRIGRITELFISKDGKIRNAEVIMKDKGTRLRRSINLLYPIVQRKEPEKPEASK